MTGPRAARPASVHAQWPLLPEPRQCVAGSCRCRVPGSRWGQASLPRRLPDWGAGRAAAHLSLPLLCPAGNGQFRLPGHGGESWRPAVRTGRLGPLGSQAPCHLAVRSCFHICGLRAASPASTPIDLLKHGLRGTPAQAGDGTECPGSSAQGWGGGRPGHSGRGALAADRGVWRSLAVL